jgi:hypothetical protein
MKTLKMKKIEPHAEKNEKYLIEVRTKKIISTIICAFTKKNKP